jgi:hypothetical protein
MIKIGFILKDTHVTVKFRHRQLITGIILASEHVNWKLASNSLNLNDSINLTGPFVQVVSFGRRVTSDEI